METGYMASPYPTHKRPSTHHDGTSLMCPPILAHKAPEWKASGAVASAQSIQDGVIAPDHRHVVNDPRVHVGLFDALPEEVQVLISGCSVAFLAHRKASFIFAKRELPWKSMRQ